MSDTTEKRLKVSREGVVLIKSFEGFRASAQPRPDGGWVIGYGHTRSAREGLTVSEADAELLLQYDLLPVVAMLNQRLPAAINQHQFDALASYAFSTGLDRFKASPVLELLEAGAVDEAADAMVGSPEIAPADAVLRRRAAERALFVADAGAPVTLAQLMAAPLPLPISVTDPAPAEETGARKPDVEAEASPVSDAPDAPDVALEPETTEAAEDHLDTDAADGASETPADTADEQPLEPEAVDDMPTTAVIDGLEPVEEPSPDVDAVDAPAAIEADHMSLADSVPETGSIDVAASEAADPLSSTVEAAPREAAVALDQNPTIAPLTEPVAASRTEAAEPEPTRAPITASAAINLRLSPYAGIIVGRIPGLDGAMSVVADDPIAQPPEVEAPTSATAHERIEAPALAPEPETFDGAADTLTAAPSLIDAPGLVLTPPEPMEAPVLRPLWSDADRAAATTDAPPMFDEVLQPAASAILRHEAETALRRTPWSETGAFAAMGGIGLVSFGAAVAGFRKAAEGGVEGPQLSMVSWVLVLIALICVAVSGYNLFRVWTGDRGAN